MQDNVSSYLQCTPFNGTSFGATGTSGLVDWGYPGTDFWIPTSDGADYCRLTGGGQDNVSSYLQCTPFNGTSFGATATSGLVDWGYPDSTAAWVPTGTGADYCRRTGVQDNVSSYLQCTPFNGTSFGATGTSGLVDWGYPDSTAAWVPTGTGADYCRRTGVQDNVSSYLQCTPFNGTSFGATATSGLVDWGYPDSTAAWVPTGTGADYCRRTGVQDNVSSYLQCTPFNGTSFGATGTSGLVDWGYPDSTAAWVPTGTGADYCRRTGVQDNVSSYLQCTPFNGTSFGATGTSGLVDWGYPDSTAAWVPSAG